MPGVYRIEDLIAWQLACELRDEIFRLTASGPASRDFDFRDQIRDASSSAARNLAEGFDLFKPRLFAKHARIARGSLGETSDCLLEGRNI
jgi:four helix bundle protein